MLLLAPGGKMRDPGNEVGFKNFLACFIYNKHVVGLKADSAFTYKVLIPFADGCKKATNQTEALFPTWQV